MRWVVLILMVLLLLRLVIGTVRDRIRDRSCCPADPKDDLRMRAAFRDEP